MDCGNIRFSDDPSERAFSESRYAPYAYYKSIGRFNGQLISIFHYSFGNFDFDFIKYATPFQTNLFYMYFIFSVTVLNIVFLNFIIAEVTNSYEEVTKNLHSTVLQQRANLINESEDMIKSMFGANRQR